MKTILISLLLSVGAAGGTIDLDGATITGQLPTANATTVLTAAKVGASYTGIVNTNYAQTNDSALGSAVSWAATQHRATLTGNATVSFSNVPASGTVGLITIKITQDGTGGRTVTWPASVITAPQINPVASSVTTVTLLVDDYVDATTPKIRAFSDYQGNTVINGTLAVAGAITNASVEVPTISSTSTLTNKTINGANNTLTVRLANDISGFGTGVATALGVNIGSAGAFTTFNGAGGTPSSITLTNATGLPRELIVAIGDETTAITTGTAKVTMRAPYAMTITGVRASLNTVSSSGIPTVDINEAGTTILSTKLTIDASELSSTTAATPAVISDASIADDAELTFDIDVAGTGAKGLKVCIYYTR